MNIHPNNDFMVDLETLGKHPKAPIVSIGVVPFNLSRRQVGDKTFYAEINLQSSIDLGLTMDPSTVLWWMRQSEDARKVFANVEDGKGEPLTKALADLTAFIESIYPNKNKVNIWGNASTFDNVILGGSYDAAQMERPWEFWGDCCYRTMKNQRPMIKPQRMGTYHNALDDALTQVHHLFKVMDSIEGKA